MRVPVIGIEIDERFLTHRLKSTSIAGMAGVVVAMGLFLYRFYADHFWSWDLFAVGVTMALVKVTMMVWFRLHD
jgi:Kef-type K+ transport system membrane component KefB